MLIRIRWAAVIFGIVGMVIAACTGGGQIASIPSDTSAAPSFETILSEYTEWTPQEEAPRNVGMEIFLLCRLPNDFEMAFAESEEHGNYYLMDYMNDIGIEALENDAATYPVGTVIVKEKFRELDQESPDALGVMVKREAGYNPGGGDWQFIYAEGETVSDTIEATESCQSCHEAAERDYVFGGNGYPLGS